MSIEADKRVSEQLGIERVAEHVSYTKHETGLLEVMLAGLQQRMLWAIDLENVVLNSRRNNV